MISEIERSIRRNIICSCVCVAALAGGVAGWAANTHFAGAVVAPGNLVVDTSVKKVQHPTGGVVKELLVREGDLVSAGVVLLRMDDTQTRANLTIVLRNLAEMSARQARLEAEREDANMLDFRDLRAVPLPSADLERLVGAETRLYELRRSARAGQKAQLRERTGQLKEEIQGLTGQVDAKLQELKLIATELGGVRELWVRKLISLQRVTQVERDLARTDGERNALLSQIAQAKGKTTETELQIIQVDQDLRGEVAKELRDIQGKIGEFQERRIAAEDQLQRIELRAPQSGRVHQLAVHTIGGVVSPAEPIMLIVPDGELLTVEARLPPQDIDQVHNGLPAVIRLVAANQRTTPELKGQVSLVSADINVDPKTAASYYTVRITLGPDELGHLEGVKLVPGMPVESFIQTGERTVLSYLLKPLSDQIMRTFRER